MKKIMIGWIFLIAIAFFILAFFLESLILVGIYLVLSLTMFTWGYFELRKEIDRINEEQLEESIELLTSVPYTKYILSDDQLSGLLIDERNKYFYFAKREEIGVEFNHKEFHLSKLLEVAIFEDGKVKYMFPKDGMIGSAIGGNQSEKSDEKNSMVKKLTLKIVIDDFLNHTIEYAFIDSEEPVEKDDDYKDTFKKCYDWYQTMSIAINRNKQENSLVIHG